MTAKPQFVCNDNRDLPGHRTLQVLRYTTMMQKKKNCSSSNRWDAPADIMMTEYRLEVLQEYRGHILSGTLLTGMKVELRPSELNVEKQYKGQQSLKVNYM